MNHPHNQRFANYLSERAGYFSASSEPELKALDELQDHIKEVVAGFSTRQDQITAEANEYQRHFNGYFALSISFLISGMLASQLSGADTHPAKVFFFWTIVVSLTAALLLFLDYILTYRLFNAWQQNIRDNLTYIAGDDWNDPNELDNWLREHQNGLKERSTHLIQYAEMALLATAFILLSCWLYQRLFVVGAVIHHTPHILSSLKTVKLSGMHAAKLLMIIGLSLNVIGVAVLFFIPYPAPDTDSETVGALMVEDANVMPSGKTAGQERSERSKRKEKFKKISFAAFSIMLLGFGLQLWSVLITH